MYPSFDRRVVWVRIQSERTVGGKQCRYGHRCIAPPSISHIGFSAVAFSTIAAGATVSATSSRATTGRIARCERAVSVTSFCERYIVVSRPKINRPLAVEWRATIQHIEVALVA